ncbi:helix-turn-helix domain-containing protein [Paenibacillus ehimensis]
MNFSEAVKKAMKEMDLRTSDIARTTGYSYQHIYDLLSGERRWNEDSINKVCAALGIKIEIKYGGCRK